MLNPVRLLRLVQLPMPVGLEKGAELQHEHNIRAFGEFIESSTSKLSWLELRRHRQAVQCSGSAPLQWHCLRVRARSI